jgi:hypothetical protein
MAQSFEELEMVILNGNSIQKEPIRTSSDGLHCIGYRTAKDKVVHDVMFDWCNEVKTHALIKFSVIQQQ